jgi:hypothetical protein
MIRVSQVPCKHCRCAHDTGQLCTKLELPAPESVTGVLVEGAVQLLPSSCHGLAHLLPGVTQTRRRLRPVLLSCPLSWV